jgi:hypothetical protein
MINKNYFFEDIANQLNYWIDSSFSSMTNENEDLIWTDNQSAFEKTQKIFSEEQKWTYMDTSLIASRMKPKSAR